MKHPIETIPFSQGRDIRMHIFGCYYLYVWNLFAYISIVASFELIVLVCMRLLDRFLTQLTDYPSAPVVLLVTNYF